MMTESFGDIAQNLGQLKRWRMSLQRGTDKINYEDQHDFTMRKNWGNI